MRGRRVDNILSITSGIITGIMTGFITGIMMYHFENGKKELDDLIAVITNFAIVLGQFQHYINGLSANDKTSMEDIKYFEERIKGIDQIKLNFYINQLKEHNKKNKFEAYILDEYNATILRITNEIEKLRLQTQHGIPIIPKIYVNSVIGVAREIDLQKHREDIITRSEEYRNSRGFIYGLLLNRKCFNIMLCLIIGITIAFFIIA